MIFYDVDTIGRIEAKVNGEASANKEQMTMIQHLATNLTTFAGEVMKVQGPPLNITRNKLETIVDVHYNNILDNRAQLNQLKTDVSVIQNAIQSQMTIIENLEDKYVAGNASANDHSLRIAILESEHTVNRYMSPNHTDTFELLENSLNVQNSSIQRVNEKVLKLKSEHEFDRNQVKELKASISLIEDNVTTHAVILQNYSSQLNEFDHEMTIITEKLILQHNDHEQLKENMTDHRRDSFSFHNRENELEARTINSELFLVDHDNRLRQVELRHISEIVLNEEQETQIRVLGEEMNKTWIAIQGFGEGSRDPTGKGCIEVFRKKRLVCV